MFKKLLLPVDLGDKAVTEPALEKAVGLAKMWDAELRLVYIMPIVPSTYLEYVPADFETGERSRIVEEMMKLADGMGLPASKVSTAIRSGGVYHEILAEANEAKCDLIICGSHHPTLATYLVGSHATNIARHADCSVLVVRT